MKQCPKCGLYTMDFDEYFGRHRCFNAKCAWMPPSASERRLRLLEKGAELENVASFNIDEAGLIVSVLYDRVNDVLLFDFDTGELAFDYPSDDPRISWNVGRQTGQLCGLAICGAREFGVSEVHLDIVASIGLATRSANAPLMPIAGRPSRAAIENTRVTLKSQCPTPEMHEAITPMFQEAIKGFAARHA